MGRDEEQWRLPMGRKEGSETQVVTSPDLA